jgi:RNA polymerase sigma factor (sigma-70 family)
MGIDSPLELAALLAASEPSRREAAWERFVALHSRLLMNVARSLGSDYDGSMDRYAHILEQLQEGDFRRLRAYAPDGRTRFTTWLVVVARRLCLDHYRQRYGRSPSGQRADAQATRSFRRQLADSVGAGIDVESVSFPDQDDPQGTLERQSHSALLASVVARLGPEDRLLLRLRFDDGLSAREIAAIVGAPTPFHIYRRLNAIYASLRQGLADQGLRDLEA